MNMNRIGVDFGVRPMEIFEKEDGLTNRVDFGVVS